MTDGIRVLVTGSRHFVDRDRMFDVLDRIDRDRGIAVIIHGAARGADTWAQQWAVQRRRPFEPYRANWTDLSHPDAVIKTRPDGSQYDALAGFRRNQRMIDLARPDLVVAFDPGEGTRDCIKRAQTAGIPVQISERPT